MSFLAKNYNRKKISFKYGKGSYLYSYNGKKYLDFVRGAIGGADAYGGGRLERGIKRRSGHEAGSQHFEEGIVVISGSAYEFKEVEISGISIGGRKLAN